MGRVGLFIQKVLNECWRIFGLKQVGNNSLGHCSFMSWNINAGMISSSTPAELHKYGQFLREPEFITHQLNFIWKPICNWYSSRITAWLSHISNGLCGLCSAPAGPQSSLSQKRLLLSNIGIRKAHNTEVKAVLKTDTFSVSRLEIVKEKAMPGPFSQLTSSFCSVSVPWEESGILTASGKLDFQGLWWKSWKCWHQIRHAFQYWA